VLVVVDVQERLAAAMDHRDMVVERVRLLVAAASIVGVPIVVTRQYPRGLGDLCPEIGSALTAAEADGARVKRADKVAFDCFGEPEFVRLIESCDCRQMVIAGMESHICITQTALAALRGGYGVHVVADACCSREKAASDTALARLACAGAVVTTAESVAYELVGQAGTPEFKRLLAAVKGE
jgi:nicotinamidase-related amidase